MILIVGGSGNLGSAVVRRLLAQGKPLRVMTRSPDALAHLKQQGVEVVTGDLLDPASLQTACLGVEQVVAAAHALNGNGKNSPTTVDDLGSRQLIDTAKAAGVKHFIYISTQGASPQSPLPFFRIKFGIEEYLRSSRLSYTIFRPASYMELWGKMIGEPILTQGKAMVFGRGENPINFIAVDDLASLICTALDDPRAAGLTIDAGGPEDLTLNQVAAIFERMRGQPVKVSHIPVPMLRGISALMRLANPTLARLIQTSIYMDMQDLRFPTPETYRLFPLRQTRFEDWAQARYSPQRELLSI